MTTYYRSSAARITRDRFEVRGHSRHTFAIRDLDRVFVVLPERRFRWQRPYQLWAVYHGRLVLLFHTTDRVVFGQVRRALLRAIESWQR